MECDGMQWEFTNDPKEMPNAAFREDILDTICYSKVVNRQPKSGDLTPVARVLLNDKHEHTAKRWPPRSGSVGLLFCHILPRKRDPPLLAPPDDLLHDSLHVGFEGCSHLAIPDISYGYLEKAGVGMQAMERVDIKSKFDSSTLSRMRIMLPKDQREPLQIKAARPTAPRMSATTSPLGRDPDWQLHMTGGGEEVTSRPPEVSTMKDNFVAIKEQHALLSI